MRLGYLASSKTFIACIVLSLGAASASVACSSNKGGAIDDDAGSGSSGSSGSGSGSSGSGTSGSSGASGSDSGSGSMNTKPLDGGPTIVQCGSGSCNLSKNTACVGITSSLQPTCDCIDSGASCPSMTAAFNCGGSADCTKGEVCCGQVDQSSITASTSCKATCPTTTMNNGQQGQSQVCSSNADCQSGVECIPQSCGFMGLAKLNLCGMQTAAPFSCTRQ